MLVVLAIIVVITAITVVGQSNFNRTLILTDTAYTIALSIREAQSLGLSSRLFTATSTPNTSIANAGYGVHFTMTAPTPETSYVQFSDTGQTVALPVASGCPTGTAGHPDAKPGNCVYDGPGTDGLLQTYTLGQGLTITDICGIESNSTKVCASTNQGSAYAMDIVFSRPETNAVITTVLNGAEIPMTEAIIHLSAPTTGTRCVVVTQLGQVSVTSTCP